MTPDPVDRLSPPDDSHAIPAGDVAAALGVDPARGLEPDDVDRRLTSAGANELEEVERPGPLRMVVEAATEPFVLLLFAAGLGAIVLGEARDGILILIGLLPIIGADVVTEYRGERALEALREASAPHARVRRGGGVLDVPAATLVPGDVVLLRAGDVVPADIRLTRADRLVIDRSALTGESVPEPGEVAPDAPGAPLADRRSIAYSGTGVVGGRGEGVVVATGTRTEVGRIAGGLATRQRRRSPLQLELDRLTRILLVVAIGLIAITTGLGFLRGNPAGENLLAGISAAIAAIPEEPPVLLAVILGLGAYRLLRRSVLVRRLNAEEVLGAVDLIVTDKTGTLTANRLEVASVSDVDGGVVEPGRRTELLVDALRAEDDAWARGEGAQAGSFTTALARAVEAAGGRTELDPADLLAADPIVEGRPFAVTVSRRDAGIETLALGAPEAVAELALGSGPQRERWHRLIEAGASSGGRLLGLARRAGDGRSTDGGSIVGGSTAGGSIAAGSPSATEAGRDGAWRMEALIHFADPLRPGIGQAMEAALGAGIQTIVVTGDHPTTAHAIAREAGLAGGDVVTGTTLATWDDDRLAKEIPELAIVARSTPDQKERIVTVARRSGRLVAVTGDGVNDAPALHNADVAVAMGSGTAVAKEASDLVLGDDSFATLVYGIREGRRIVDNVQKGLVFLVSTHVALLGFLLIATLAGFSQPLLPIQILWLELFIDLSASIAFEREPAEPDIMRRRPRAVGQPLLTDSLLGRIVLAGGFSAVAALVLISTHDGGPEHARWLAYTTLVCAQLVRAYANRSLREPIHRLAPNGFLLVTALAIFVIQVAIPYIPPLADAFRATPLDAFDWTLVAIVAFAPALLAQGIRMFGRTAWVA